MTCERCTLDLSVVKAQGSIAGFLFFYHSTIPEKTYIFGCGVVFSIKFLSSSAILGFRKALEQNAVSSSFSRRKVQNTCTVLVSC